MQEIAKNNWAVIFPGQGSQEQGMGRDLAESDEQAMELWKTAEKISGHALREIFWYGDAQDMAETKYQQPALIVVSLTFWNILKKWIEPVFFTGHSVGEYAALGAAGVLQQESVLKLVSLRSRLMSEANQVQLGSMGAVLKLDKQLVHKIVEKVKEETNQELCVANYNTPVQQVVSGAEDPLKRVAELVKKHKGRFIALPVSGAFHSKLMEEPARELARYMRKFDWIPARRAVHLNVTAKAETDPEVILENMEKQMISPVNWEQIILDQWDKGVRQWIEIGPKGVLTKMLNYILEEKESEWQGSKLSSLKEFEKLNFNSVSF